MATEEPVSWSFEELGSHERHKRGLRVAAYQTSPNAPTNLSVDRHIDWIEW